MSKAIYSLMALLLLGASMNLSAQRGYRDYLRGGDKHYTDSLYEKSEIQYRKALEKDANGVNAFYNLGNSLLMQSKAKDAMDQYKIVEKKVDEAGKLAQIHHNMGVIYHGSKDYAAAVESYKQSLRENPNDDETRYNLALAMRKLKEQQQQQQQQEQQQQEQQEQQEQQQQEQQQQEQQQQKEQQQQEQQMSKENAEQILQAAMQDEKDVQEKVKKMMQLRGRKLEKDW